MTKPAIFKTSINKKLNKDLPQFYFDYFNLNREKFHSDVYPLFYYSPIEMIVCTDLDIWSFTYSSCNHPEYEAPPFNTKIRLNFDMDTECLLKEIKRDLAPFKSLDQMIDLFLHSVDLFDELSKAPRICYINNSGENILNVTAPGFVLIIYTVLTEEQAQRLEQLFLQQFEKSDGPLNWSYDFFDDNVASYMLQNIIIDSRTFYYRYNNYTPEINYCSNRRRLLLPTIDFSTARAFADPNRTFARKFQIKIEGPNYWVYGNMSAWAEGFIAAVRLFFLNKGIDEHDALAYTYVDFNNNLIVDIYFDYNESWFDLRDYTNLSMIRELFTPLPNDSNFNYSLDFLQDQVTRLPDDVKDVISVVRLSCPSDKLSYGLDCLYATTSRFFGSPTFFTFTPALYGRNTFDFFKK